MSSDEAVNIWDWNGWYSTTLTGFIMLGFAGCIDWDRFKEIYNNKHTFGTLFLALLWQILVMPGIGYGLGLAFKVDIHVMFGIIVTLASPADIMCQYYTFLSGADQQLSLSITLFTHIFSYVSIPVNIWFYIINQDYDDKKSTGLDDINFEWGFLSLQNAVVIIPCIIGLIVASYEDIGSKMCMLFFGVFGALLRYIKMFYDYGYWKQTYGYTDDDMWIPLCLILIAYIVPTTFISLLKCCCGCENTKTDKKLTDKIKTKRSRGVILSFGLESSMRNIIIASAIIATNINDKDKRLQALRMPIIYTTYAYIINLITSTLLYCIGWALPDNNEHNLYDNYGNPYKDESVSLYDTYSYIQTTYVTTKKVVNDKNKKNEIKYKSAKKVNPTVQNKKITGIQYYVPQTIQTNVVQPQIVYVPQQQIQPAMIQTQPQQIQYQPTQVLVQQT